jgi:hypothetical protein
MIDNEFFDNTWMNYFPKVLPTPIPNRCYDGKIIPLSEADASVQNVINRKSLRVGIHALLLDTPYLFESNYTNSTNVTTTDTKVGGSTDAAAAVYFDGYDPTCLRELTRLLSESYQVDIQLDLIIIEGNDFFNDLRNAVNTDHVDMVWSIVTISEERSTQVDYVCPNHMSEYVIGASAKVGSSLPDPKGSPIPLLCFAISCTFTNNIPAPFYLQSTDNGPERTLANTSDEYEYGLVTYEALWHYIREKCPNCTQVDMSSSIARDFRAPFTKFYYNETTSSSQSQPLTSGTLKIRTIPIISTLISFSFGVVYNIQSIL